MPRGRKVSESLTEPVPPRLKQAVVKAMAGRTPRSFFHCSPSADGVAGTLLGVGTRHPSQNGS